MKVRVGVGVIALALGVIGCESAAERAGIVFDTIGGIPSVMSPERGLLGDTVPWELTQYLLVTGDQLYDRKAAVYALDVGILPNGNVVVLDSGNRRVMRFGPNGSYIDSFSGPGQEPGQFVTPLFLEVAGDRVYVLDSGLNRVTEFDSAGIYLDRYEVTLAGLAGTTPLFAVGGSDQVYVAAEPVPFLTEVRDTGNAVIYRMNMSGAIVDTLALFLPSTWTQIESSEGKFSYVKPRLAPEPLISAEPGGVALVTGARYLIERRYPSGALVRRVARRYENVAVTAELRDSVLNELSQRSNALPRGALELVSFAPVVPAIEGLVLDDQGRLWVDVYSGDPTRRDVFDAEGQFLGALYLPQPMELEDVRGDRACGVINQLGGEAAIVCYRISESDD